MMSKFVALRVASFLAVGAAFFFPLPNTVQASVDYPLYKQVLDEARTIFTPLFAQEGNKLVFEDRWEDSGVQAIGLSIKDRYIVSILGGLARNAFVDDDVLRLIVCTAIGRKVGGAPSAQVGQQENISLPGQADYFATARCMKFWFSQFSELSNGDKDYNPVVKALCKSTFQDAKGQEICARSAHAGRSFSWALEVLSGKSPQSDFKKDVPQGLIDDYPVPQCRLNTFFAGALCAAKLEEEVSWQNPYQGYCSEKSTPYGQRPECWYNFGPGQNKIFEF